MSCGKVQGKEMTGNQNVVSSQGVTLIKERVAEQRLVVMKASGQ